MVLGGAANVGATAPTTLPFGGAQAGAVLASQAAFASAAVDIAATEAAVVPTSSTDASIAGLVPFR